MKTFDNIQPMPNPKPITVLRCQTEQRGQDGKFNGQFDTVLVRNAKIHPTELLRG